MVAQAPMPPPRCPLALALYISAAAATCCSPLAFLLLLGVLDPLGRRRVAVAGLAGLVVDIVLECCRNAHEHVSQGIGVGGYGAERDAEVQGPWRGPFFVSREEGQRGAARSSLGRQRLCGLRQPGSKEGSAIDALGPGDDVL